MKVRVPALLALAVAATLAAGGLAPATADRGSGHGNRDDVALPNGFAPEDIALGREHSFYVGSLATGAIYRGDLRSGQGAEVVPGGSPPSVGLFLEQRENHRDRLWAAGGPTGALKVYDARTGALLTTYQLADPASGPFVNDLVVSRGTAYVTDSFRQQMYAIPLGARGALPAASAVRTVPLTGDVAYTPGAFNLNGIAAQDGRLYSAQTSTGMLFSIDPMTGATTAVELTDEHGDPTTIPGADGISRDGGRLYVALNSSDQVAVVQLRHDGTQAEVRDLLDDPRLDTPTSVARDRGRLYVVNARFGTPPGPDTTYSLTVLKP